MTIPAWFLKHGETLQFALFFSLLLILALVERIAPRRTGPMDRKTRWAANFFLTFVNLIALSVLPVSLIAASVLAEKKGWGVLNRVELPLAAGIAVTLLVRGFVSFFTHLLMHKVP